MSYDRASQLGRHYAFACRLVSAGKPPFGLTMQDYQRHCGSSTPSQHKWEEINSRWKEVWTRAASIVRPIFTDATTLKKSAGSDDDLHFMTVEDGELPWKVEDPEGRSFGTRVKGYEHS